jgi:hypothetical protein
MGAASWMCLAICTPSRRLRACIVETSMEDSPPIPIPTTAVPTRVAGSRHTQTSLYLSAAVPFHLNSPGPRRMWFPPGLRLSTSIDRSATRAYARTIIEVERCGRVATASSHESCVRRVSVAHSIPNHPKTPRASASPGGSFSAEYHHAKSSYWGVDRLGRRLRIGLRESRPDRARWRRGGRLHQARRGRDRRWPGRWLHCNGWRRA